MKTNKYVRGFCLLSVIFALPLMLVPSASMAGGGGPEPGAGCGQGFHPQGPPFTGEITLEFIQGTDGDFNYTFATGLLEQVGGSGCTISIALDRIFDGDLNDFQNLEPNDLTGFECLYPTPPAFAPSCLDFEQYGVVGVGNLKDVNETIKTANFIVMGVVATGN